MGRADESLPTRDEALAEAYLLAVRQFECPAMSADMLAARAAMARVWLKLADRAAVDVAEDVYVPTGTEGVYVPAVDVRQCSHGHLCLVNDGHLIHPMGDRCTDGLPERARA